MEKVKFGIIGCGNIGTRHFRNLIDGKIANGELVAVSDSVPEKIADIKKQLADRNLPEDSIRFFSDGNELIGSKCCDAVIIAVPHYFHPTLAVKALENGINAITEKPAGVYTLQVEEMLEHAKKHPELKLGIMFNQRTNPAFKMMKKLIADGQLGKISRLNWIITDWFRTQSYYDGGGWRATWKGEGGGVLFNQAPHNIDLFQWIPDMMPIKVRAFCKFGKYHDIEVEDDVTAYFEYENGATGVFITSTGDAPGTNRFEVTGENGKLVYDGGNLTFWKNETSSLEYIKTDTNGFRAPKCEQTVFTNEELCGLMGENSQHAGILNNFANAVLGLEPLYAPASDGLKGVVLANAMLLSAWTDADVEIPFDGQKYLDLLNRHIASSTVVKKNAVGKAADLSDTFNSK